MVGLSGGSSKCLSRSSKMHGTLKREHWTNSLWRCGERFRLEIEAEDQHHKPLNLGQCDTLFAQ